MLHQLNCEAKPNIVTLAFWTSFPVFNTQASDLWSNPKHCLLGFQTSFSSLSSTHWTTSEANPNIVTGLAFKHRFARNVLITDLRSKLGHYLLGIQTPCSWQCITDWTMWSKYEHCHLGFWTSFRSQWSTNWSIKLTWTSSLRYSGIP